MIQKCSFMTQNSSDCYNPTATTASRGYCYSRQNLINREKILFNQITQYWHYCGKLGSLVLLSRGMPEEKGQCFLLQDILENDTRNSSSRQEVTMYMKMEANFSIRLLEAGVCFYPSQLHLWFPVSARTLLEAKHLKESSLQSSVNEMLIRKITTLLCYSSFHHW